VHRAFAEIRAEERLKENTMAYLEKTINRKKRRPFARSAAVCACVLLLFFGGFLSYQSYCKVTAYVDIDVNPGVELILNRYNRVIDVSAYNDDGADLLAKVSLKNKEVKDAFRLLTREMGDRGYIRNAELFSLTLQTEGEDQAELLDALNAILAALLTDAQQEMELDVFAVDAATKTASHDLHLSPAKYLAIRQLQSVDPSATFENCRDHTIGEIKEQTHIHMNGRHDESDSSAHESEHNGNAASGGSGENPADSGQNRHGGASPEHTTQSDNEQDSRRNHSGHD
jgi:hypothetical protein